MRTERETEDGLRVGQLAAKSGLTVRALHHYDRIGLLGPSGRTAAGHRRYTEADVRRLYAIVALRHLGMPLGRIAATLEADGSSFRAAVAGHLEEVDRRIDRERRIRARLARILDALDRTGRTTVDDLMGTMEAMAMHERYFTEEQQAALARRAEDLGQDAIAAAEREWADLIARVRAERDAGTDPADPRVRALAVRWQELVEAFTGGDEGIRNSLGRMYVQEGPEQASRGMLDKGLMAYIGRAFAAGAPPAPAGPTA